MNERRIRFQIVQWHKIKEGLTSDRFMKKKFLLFLHQPVDTSDYEYLRKGRQGKFGNLSKSKCEFLHTTLM